MLLLKHLSLSGDSVTTEIRPRWTPAWFYRRIRTTVWSPALTEVTIERGIRIRSRRFSFSRTLRRWTDVYPTQTEPAINGGGV